MNADEIRKWHRVFYPDNGLFEIRLLDGKGYWSNASGYFKDVEVMLSKLLPIINNPGQYGYPQVYFTLNSLPEDLYSRKQHDEFVPKASTTLDTDVARRKFVMIDFDPKRAKGVSSNEQELQNAHKVAGNVFNFLKQNGFNEPIVALSGNGYHLQLRVDMPNDDEHRELVKGFVEAIADKFDTDGIDIDCKVFNAARICKLYGTEARKGANTKERPWREAKILYVPKELEVNPDELFRKIADTKSKDKKETGHIPFRQSNGTFDLEGWLRDHGIEYRVRVDGGITKYQLRKCPWQETHSTDKDWESMVFRGPDGKICFSCWHDHCKDKKWEDVRELYEPGYKQRLASARFAQRTFSPKIDPVIKSEDIARYGSKWLSLSQIKRIYLDTLEKVRTGFDVLDGYITALFMGEVTLLSGSNGSGKSSWVNTLTLNIVQQGWKVALWSGELPAPDLKNWIEMAAAGPRYVKPSMKFPGRFYCPNRIGEKIDKWLEGKFALYNNEYGYQWAQLFNDMKTLRQRGVRFFIIDNLMALDVDLINGDKNRQQKSVVNDIKNFAKQQNCHIILIAHPRKGSARGKFSLLRKDDIAGTSDLSNMVDNVFIIHRKNEDFLKGYAEYYGKAKADELRDTEFGNFVEICKNRRFGVLDKMCGIYYDTASRRFENSSDENVEYGWNDGAAVQSEMEMDPLGLPVTSDDAPF